MASIPHELVLGQKKLGDCGYFRNECMQNSVLHVSPSARTNGKIHHKNCMAGGLGGCSHGIFTVCKSAGSFYVEKFKCDLKPRLSGVG